MTLYILLIHKSWVNKLFCLQEEACVRHTEYPRDDPTNGKARDLEHSERHRKYRRPRANVPRQGSVRWSARDIRSTLSERGPEPHRPHRFIALLQHEDSSQEDSNQGESGWHAVSLLKGSRRFWRALEQTTLTLSVVLLLSRDMRSFWDACALQDLWT